MMNDMMSAKQGYSFYAHNLGKFDGLLVLQALDGTDLETNITFRENSIIGIEIHYGKHHHLYLMDSLLMTNASLAKLAQSFRLENKGSFPYDFVNGNTLDYVGEVPDLKY